MFLILNLVRTVPSRSLIWAHCCKAWQPLTLVSSPQALKMATLVLVLNEVVNLTEGPALPNFTIPVQMCLWCMCCIHWWWHSYGGHLKGSEHLYLEAESLLITWIGLGPLILFYFILLGETLFLEQHSEGAKMMYIFVLEIQSHNVHQPHNGGPARTPISLADSLLKPLMYSSLCWQSTERH